MGADVVPIGLGLLTCLLFDGLVYLEFAAARRGEPWLIYDKTTGRVELPREHMSFERKETVHLQYITTKSLTDPSIQDTSQAPSRRSELNLITLRDGVRQRWHLLRSSSAWNAFDGILLPLMRETDLPVVRVRDDLHGWKVTEEPYSGHESWLTILRKDERTSRSFRAAAVWLWMVPLASLSLTVLLVGVVALLNGNWSLPFVSITAIGLLLLSISGVLVFKVRKGCLDRRAEPSCAETRSEVDVQK